MQRLSTYSTHIVNLQGQVELLWQKRTRRSWVLQKPLFSCISGILLQLSDITFDVICKNMISRKTFSGQVTKTRDVYIRRNNFHFTIPEIENLEKVLSCISLEQYTYFNWVLEEQTVIEYSRNSTPIIIHVFIVHTFTLHRLVILIPILTCLFPFNK